jgi:phage recombination protein Bet
MSNGKVQEETGVVEYQARDGQKIKLSPEIIKKLLVRGYPEMVTNQELYFFMGICKSRGLNPFINDCYPIKYTKDPMAIVTSIDYYRKRARAKPDCRGWKKGIVLLDADGKLAYREGCILLDGEKLIGGWAEAKPEKIEVPFRVEVNLKRYIKKTKEGAITRFWSEENQPEQIAKVAESQCLRMAWTDEFQGLYTDAEAQSRDAQDELNSAVSTPSAGEPDDLPIFEDIFAEEIAIWDGK